MALGSIQVVVSNWNWEQELQADSFAFQLLLWNNDEPLGMDAVYRYTGAEFFLQTTTLFEELTGSAGSQTHPPASMRLHTLRDFASSSCADEYSRNVLYKAAGALQQLFNSVRELLLKPTETWVQRRMRATEAVNQQLDDLLLRYSGGLVPDYMGFGPEAFALLDREPTDIVADAINGRLKRFGEELQLLIDGNQNTEAHITFQKMKLLNHLLQCLPPPVQAVIWPTFQL
jgi:hypothetical protein